MPNSPKTISDCIYYAIGDVHGEAARLKQLHSAIFEHHNHVFPNMAQIIVHLGDYVDRGPDSCATVQLLIDFETECIGSEGVHVVNLQGNHEDQMLAAMENPEGPEMRIWMRDLIGGEATLQSYERRGALGERQLEAHNAWLRGLPTIWCPETVPFVFVHAGVDSAIFPEEDESVYLWTRSSQFFETRNWSSSALKGKTIIHGHTPTRDNCPEIDIYGNERRINVDTGAVYGGPLTCAVIDPRADEVGFLYA